MLDVGLVNLVADRTATKTIATTGTDETPSIALSPWLETTEDGYFVHPELHLASPSSQNLIHSLWFNRKVAISIAAETQQWHITGIPIKAHVCGSVFRRFYELIRSQWGDVDLAAVYLIKPVEIRLDSILVRQASEDALHPFYRHLDRQAISQTTVVD
jgi:hypothetical protein